jgi:hypothetical protein
MAGVLEWDGMDLKKKKEWDGMYVHNASETFIICSYFHKEVKV